MTQFTYRHPEHRGQIVSQQDMLAITGYDRHGVVQRRFAIFKGEGQPPGTLVDAGAGYSFVLTVEAIAEIERRRRLAEGHRPDRARSVIVRPRNVVIQEDVVHSSTNGMAF